MVAQVLQEHQVQVVHQVLQEQVVRQELVELQVLVLNLVGHHQLVLIYQH